MAEGKTVLGIFKELRAKEELTQKEILQALRKKVPAKVFLDGKNVIFVPV